jgi:hypothetical protein
MWFQIAKLIVKRAVQAAPAIAAASGVLIRIGVGILRQPVRFIKTTFRPSTATKVINPVAKITVTDITPVVRAAIQVRAIPRVVARGTYRFVRYYAPKKVLSETRKVIRDALAPMYTTIHAYHIFRLTRITAARATAVERVLDKTLWKFTKVLRPLKLTPKFSLTTRSYIRIAAAGVVYHEFQAIKGALKEGYGTAAEKLRKAANSHQVIVNTPTIVENHPEVIQKPPVMPVPPSQTTPVPAKPRVANPQPIIKPKIILRDPSFKR